MRTRRLPDTTLEATIDSRGRVTIPEPIREAVGLQPGDAVTVGVDSDRVHVEPTGDTLEEYLHAFPKRPEPDSVDWDARRYGGR